MAQKEKVSVKIKNCISKSCFLFMNWGKKPRKKIMAFGFVTAINKPCRKSCKLLGDGVVVGLDDIIKLACFLFKYFIPRYIK